jgi:hypothetical protein
VRGYVCGGSADRTASAVGSDLRCCQPGNRGHALQHRDEHACGRDGLLECLRPPRDAADPGDQEESQGTQITAGWTARWGVGEIRHAQLVGEFLDAVGLDRAAPMAPTRTSSSDTRGVSHDRG